MADQYDKPHSDPQGPGYSGKERSVQSREDAEMRDVSNAMPEEAGNDFTFPDEDETLGRKAGDDLPGEKAHNRD